MSVGAFLRQWLMPDAIITSGGMGEQLKARIFWSNRTTVYRLVCRDAGCGATN
ncbi:Uncharacterised protein [Escherichia coli]|nr:Uncharacterised protein [Escherichia coli]